MASICLGLNVLKMWDTCALIFHKKFFNNLHYVGVEK